MDALNRPLPAVGRREVERLSPLARSTCADRQIHRRSQWVTVRPALHVAGGRVGWCGHDGDLYVIGVEFGSDAISVSVW
jgi:hypothetical protein